MLRESIVGKHPLFTAAEHHGTNLLSIFFLLQVLATSRMHDVRVVGLSLLS